MSCTWFYLLYFFLSRIATKPTKSSKRNSPWAVQQPACQSPPWRSCTPSTSVWARSDVSHQRPLTDPKHWTPQPENILRFCAMISCQATKSRRPMPRSSRSLAGLNQHSKQDQHLRFCLATLEAPLSECMGKSLASYPLFKTNAYGCIRLWSSSPFEEELRKLAAFNSS